MVDGDVVERLLGVCGDVGRVKGVAGRLCFQPEGAGVFRRPCRRQKLCPPGRGSIAPSSWWCRNRDEEGQVVGQGMLNENGRLGGLVKSQETLLGRGIAQQLVLEEGILGASRGPKRQAPGSLHHDLELARVGVAPGLGDQVLQRSLQLGLFLGLLDDGLQSGEAPFPVCDGLLAPRDPLGVQRGQSQSQLLHAIHGVLGHALDFQEPC